MASDEDSSSDDETDINTRKSSRQKSTPAMFKARPEQKRENLFKQYNSNKEYADDRNSILDTEITKHFPGHGSFNGKITEYHPASEQLLHQLSRRRFQNYV